MGMTIDEVEQWARQNNYTIVSDDWWNAAQDTINKYQQLQSDYENRLKADLVAMLTEIQLELEETAKDAHTNAFMNGYKDMYLNGISASAIKCSEIIQQKIDKLKEA